MKPEVGAACWARRRRPRMAARRPAASRSSASRVGDGRSTCARRADRPALRASLAGVRMSVRPVAVDVTQRRCRGRRLCRLTTCLISFTRRCSLHTTPAASAVRSSCRDHFRWALPSLSMIRASTSELDREARVDLTPFGPTTPPALPGFFHRAAIFFANRETDTKRHGTSRLRSRLTGRSLRIVDVSCFVISP